jgi:hypothetical protein
VSSVLTAGLPFLVIGAVFLGLGLYWSWQSRQFARTAARAQGEVIDLVQRLGGRSGLASQGPRWHPVVRYRTADGHVVQFVSNFGTSPSIWHTGQMVTVLYDPMQPESARVETRAWSLFNFAFIAMGGCAIVLGVLSMLLFGLAAGITAGTR